MKKLSLAFAALLIMMSMFTGCDRVTKTMENNKSVVTEPIEPDKTPAPATERSGKLESDEFEIDIADGWTENNRISTTKMVIAPDGASSLNVVVENLERAFSAEEYLAESKIALDGVEMFKDRKEIPIENVKIGDYESSCYKYSIVNQNISMIMTQYFIVNGKKTYIITYTAVNGMNYDKSVAEMVSSFVIK